MRDLDMVNLPPGGLEPVKVRLCSVCDFRCYGDVERIADPEITVDVVLFYIFNEGRPGRLFVFEDLQHISLSIRRVVRRV